MRTILSSVLLFICTANLGAAQSLAARRALCEAAENAINGSPGKIENWPDSMIQTIMRISKKQKPLTSKRRSSSQAEVFRESSKVGLLPSHFRMMGRLTGTFDDYVKSDFRDWASELRVLCGLIRPELIADAKDFRGQAFKDVPLRELPLNFNLATSQEPVDFVRIGMRVGNILIRAERIWTWSMITVCDTSASATEKPPTREEVITLVQRYFRYPLDTWGLVPDSKAAKANTPYFELLRVMTPLFQE